MKILGTGLSGLVGSRVVELLSPKHTFQNLSLETGVDITRPQIIKRIFQASDAPWVFHFAAKTDVDGCEKEKGLGQGSLAWTINVSATENIVAQCQRLGKRLLYISTDFVFDGTAESYMEEDKPNPQSWYAMTKYEGEKRVYELGDMGLVIRISFPYRAFPRQKPDFVLSMRKKLESDNKVTAPTDQLFVPTFIDDLTQAIDCLVEANKSGIYHVVGSQALSPYAAAQKIAAIFHLNSLRIAPTTFAQYYQGRAPRPFRAVLKNDKISKFGIHMSTFDEGLAKLKEQQL